MFSLTAWLTESIVELYKNGTYTEAYAAVMCGRLVAGGVFTESNAAAVYAGIAALKAEAEVNTDE